VQDEELVSQENEKHKKTSRSRYKFARSAKIIFGLFDYAHRARSAV
jgi:hypothetical protein